MKCAQCQSPLEAGQSTCPACGKPPKARRKRRPEPESEALSEEAQVLIRQAHLQYNRVLWGLIPGIGLFVGPWVCWGTLHLRRNPGTKPWQPFLRTTFRIALIITLSQWLGLGLILLSFRTG